MARTEPILSAAAVHVRPSLRAARPGRRMPVVLWVPRRARPAIVVSVLLHLAALALLLWLPKGAPPEQAMPPGVEMVFTPGVATPTVPRQAMASLLDRLARQGFDLERLEMTKQAR